MTTPEREKVRQKKLTCTQKTASRKFFSYSIKTNQEKRSQAPELHQANHLTSTKIASGIPYWLNKDPLGESGGTNLYHFVYNDSVNRLDILGLQPCDSESCPAKCNVLIEISHSKSHQQIKYKKKLDSTRQALGLIGCSRQTDIWNQELIDLGVGIPGIPMNDDTKVGAGSHCPNGDDHATGDEGFNTYIKTAWNAAWTKAADLCDKGCCTTTIKVICSKTDGANTKEEANRTGQPWSSYLVMKETGYADEWCGKTEVMDCDPFD